MGKYEETFQTLFSVTDRLSQINSVDAIEILLTETITDVTRGALDSEIFFGEATRDKRFAIDSLVLEITNTLITIVSNIELLKHHSIEKAGSVKQYSFAIAYETVHRILGNQERQTPA